MNEYVTDAIVLDREVTGESDSRVFLFTKLLGRVTARAKSSKKIYSKLSGHLEPLTIVTVRLVEKSGFQIVDAVACGRVAKESGKICEVLTVLAMIKRLTEPHHPDAELWQLIERGELLGRSFLKIMGFDPEHARCDQCERPNPSYFIPSDSLYRCRSCLGRRTTSDFELSVV